MSVVLWLRWRTPWARRMRRRGALFGFSPGPGESPAAFRARLDYALRR